MNVGVEVNNFENDNVNFNLRARLTFLDIGGEGNEWRNDLSIGSRTLLATEFYHPIENSRLFVAPRALFEKRQVQLTIKAK